MSQPNCKVVLDFYFAKKFRRSKATGNPQS
jgi:hypothetical protein